MIERRKDSKNRVLKEGESERKKGGYQFRYRASNGNRRYIYAQTLQELRQKEEDIMRDKRDGIRTDAQRVTVNDMYELWLTLKKGLKDNTFRGYRYSYEQYIYDDFGKTPIQKIRKTDVCRFYNYLYDTRGLKLATIDCVHTVLHQVLNLAMEDGYIRINPSDHALKELKQSRNLFTEKRKALTVEEQMLLLNFLKTTPMYNHWYPIFALMLGTGLRVGEATGLRWQDIDLEEGTISVNHTLVYYNKTSKREMKNPNCTFAINTPKTKAGCRIVPISDSVREALTLEKEYQDEVGIRSQVVVDGYRDFIFVNRFGNVQHQGTLNKALSRIIRDCNQKVLAKSHSKEPVLLPKFSCHTFRHTFTTRLVESNINIKVIQEILGHADITTTLNIYTDITKSMRDREFKTFEDFMKQAVSEYTTCTPAIHQFELEV